MKTSSIITLIAIAMTLSAVSSRAAEKLDELKKEVPAAIESFKRADSTLTPFFEKAAGYAVFPNVGKGGVVIGGAHGQGLVYERDQLVGKASMTQATVGAQIGGQVFREVIFFETKEALDAFKQSKFEMNAQVSAVAAAEGAAKNAKYREGVLVFTRAIKGLMAEASVGGQKFKFEAIEPSAK